MGKFLPEIQRVLDKQITRGDQIEGYVWRAVCQDNYLMLVYNTGAFALWHARGWPEGGIDIDFMIDLPNDYNLLEMLDEANLITAEMKRKQNEYFRTTYTKEMKERDKQEYERLKKLFGG